MIDQFVRIQLSCWLYKIDNIPTYKFCNQLRQLLILDQENPIINPHTQHITDDQFQIVKIEYQITWLVAIIYMFYIGISNWVAAYYTSITGFIKVIILSYNTSLTLILSLYDLAWASAASKLSFSSWLDLSNKLAT